MELIAKYSFLVNIILVVLHEMDAIYWKEWRLFGITDDLFGRIGFILAHIPIYLLLFFALNFFDRPFGRIISIIMSSFLIIHFFLHLSQYSNNYFNELLSSGIIASMLIVSIVQLIFTIILFFVPK